MPAAFHPFKIISAPISNVMWLKNSRSHFACKGLSVVGRNWMLTSSIFFPSDSSFSVCLEYHSESYFLRKVLQCLLTIRSNSWNMWVMLFGTKTNKMLCFCKKEVTFSVTWLRNTSKMKRAAWSGFCNSLHWFSTYGTTISVTTLIDSWLLLKCLGFTLNENESGNSKFGRLFSLFPP